MRSLTGYLVVAVMVLVPVESRADQPKEKAAAKTVSVKEALKALPSAQGEALQRATQSLKEAADLLDKWSGPLSGIVKGAPADPDVAGRVLGLVHGRGDKGCEFIASLVTAKHTAWVRNVIQRYSALPRCDALEKAVADVLVWAPDPDTSSEAAHLINEVLAIIRDGNGRFLHESACRLVRKGPEGFRRTAIETILAARPKWGDSCLIQAYMDEQRVDKPSRTVRQDMLTAVSEYTGVDSIPTLILALNHEEDRDLACELLVGKGDDGARGLAFALRTTNARSEGIKVCLNHVGNGAVNAILPLLDHHSQAIREFALDFLSKFRTGEALQALKDRFDDGGRGIDRGRLLVMIAGYPVGQMQEMLVAALADPDRSMRLIALDAMEHSKAPEFTPALLQAAEGDLSEAVRSRALDVIWHLGVEGGEELALRMAQYEKPLVAVSAIRIVGFIHDRKAFEVLERMKESINILVVAAAKEGLWLQTFENPDDDPKYKTPTDPGTHQQGREVKCDGGWADVLGDDEPLVVVLPGGPGMDFTWASPYLDDLSDDATVAFLEPDVPREEDGEIVPRLVNPETLRSLVKALERDRCVLLSMGLGGTSALWLSSLAPEIVAGVAVISSALPGHLQGMDDALVARLKEPFRSLANPLVEGQALFRTEALSRYLARTLAPALVGDDEGDPWDMLNVAWDVAQTGRTFAVLSRPEVRFSPTEFPGKVLFTLPVKWLSEPYMQTYLDVQAMAPDRVEIKDASDCGLLPQVTCESDMVDDLEDFVKAAYRGDE